MSDQNDKSNNTWEIPGIYKIINKLNGKFYIGSASNISARFSQHKQLLRRNSSHNMHLQAAWNKYGEENFDFVVVERALQNFSNTEEKIKYIRDLEQYYLDTLRPYDKGVGYNKSTSAETPLGMKHSEETKKKLSEINIKRFQDNPMPNGEDCWNCHKLTWEKIYKIREMYLSKKFSHQKIADIMEVNRKMITMILAGERWNDGTPPLKVKKEYSSNLSEDIQNKIVEMYNGGSLMKDISVKFNTNRTTVRFILRKYGAK